MTATATKNAEKTQSQEQSLAERYHERRELVITLREERDTLTAQLKEKRAELEVAINNLTKCHIEDMPLFARNGSSKPAKQKPTEVKAEDDSWRAVAIDTLKEQHELPATCEIVRAHV